MLSVLFQDAGHHAADLAFVAHETKSDFQASLSKRLHGSIRIMGEALAAKVRDGLHVAVRFASSSGIANRLSAERLSVFQRAAAHARSQHQ